jgi:hypothetical protein
MFREQNEFSGSQYEISGSKIKLTSLVDVEPLALIFECIFVCLSLIIIEESTSYSVVFTLDKLLSQIQSVSILKVNNRALSIGNGVSGSKIEATNRLEI